MLASELHPMIVVMYGPTREDREATWLEVELHKRYVDLDAEIETRGGIA